MFFFRSSPRPHPGLPACHPPRRICCPCPPSLRVQGGAFNDAIFIVPPGLEAKWLPPCSWLFSPHACPLHVISSVYFAVQVFLTPLKVRGGGHFVCFYYRSPVSSVLPQARVPQLLCFPYSLLFVWGRTPRNFLICASEVCTCHWGEKSA